MSEPSVLEAGYAVSIHSYAADGRTGVRHGDETRVAGLAAARDHLAFLAELHGADNPDHNMWEVVTFPPATDTRVVLCRLEILNIDSDGKPIIAWRREQPAERYLARIYDHGKSVMWTDLHSGREARLANPFVDGTIAEREAADSLEGIHPFRAA